MVILNIWSFKVVTNPSGAGQKAFWYNFMGSEKAVFTDFH